MSAACTNGVDVGFAALSYLQIGFLGVVQGITELLPISSTAHMRIVPAVLGWNDPGSAFSAIMQLAALAAVLSYFSKDVRTLLSGTVHALKRRDYESRDLRLAVGIVLATIPIAVAGLLLSPLLNACNTPLRGLQVIAVASIGMATLLAVSEWKCSHTRLLRDLRLRDALWVGLAQVGALIPGVSRSGSTLTGALFLNFSREEAARLSFLIGLPAIALAGLKELLVLWQRPHCARRLVASAGGSGSWKCLCLCCNLGLDAVSGEIFDLDICRLPRPDGRLASGRAERRLAGLVQPTGNGQSP